MDRNDTHFLRLHWRSAGVWMATAMALLQATYALLAYADPAAFAGYRGTPLACAADADWVSIYASRTLFIAWVLGLLLLRGDLRALQWVALLGILMPATDAVLALQDAAPLAVVGRHLATITFLIVAFLMLGRWSRRHRPTDESQSLITHRGAAKRG